MKMHMKANKYSKGKQMTEYLKSILSCLRLLLLVIVPPMYFPCDLTITCYVTLNECHWNECILWTKQNPKCFAYNDNNQYLRFFVYVDKKTPPMHFSCNLTQSLMSSKLLWKMWGSTIQTNKFRKTVLTFPCPFQKLVSPSQEFVVR